MSYQTQKVIRLTGFDCWRIYSTIKMHFSQESYDCFRFHFKARNLKPSLFLKRNDRYFFEKHADQFRKEIDYRRFVFANIFFSKRNWIGEFSNDSYRDYMSRQQSMSYRFRSDLRTLSRGPEGRSEPLDVVLSANACDYPLIINKMLSEEIMAETVIIMDRLTSFVSSAKVNDPVLWPSLKQSIHKAQPFVINDVDLKKMQKIALSVFTNS